MHRCGEAAETAIVDLDDQFAGKAELCIRRCQWAHRNSRGFPWLESAGKVMIHQRNETINLADTRAVYARHQYFEYSSVTDMSAINGGPSFPFLSLPAEVRDQVYRYFFADHAQEEVSIFDVLRLLPQAPIVATCHQVRDETEHMLVTARDRFWANHKIVVNLDFSFRQPLDGAVPLHADEAGRILFASSHLRGYPVKQMLLRIKTYRLLALQVVEVDLRLDQHSNLIVRRQFRGTRDLLRTHFSHQPNHDLPRWDAWVARTLNGQGSFVSMFWPGCLDAYMVARRICSCIVGESDVISWG